jgi:hypothetical protein
LAYFIAPIFLFPSSPLTSYFHLRGPSQWISKQILKITPSTFFHSQIFNDFPPWPMHRARQWFDLLPILFDYAQYVTVKFILI